MAAPNPPPQVLPEYVRFSPKSHEVILLLKRFIRKEDRPDSAVKLLSDSDLQLTLANNVWIAERYPYFEKDEYWFFLHRKASKDKKKANRRLGDLGTWKARGKSSKIYIGAQLVGLKQKYELMKGTVKTGWSQFEYTRFSNKFEKICISHLIFAEPEVGYPSDISEDEVEEESTDEEEHALVNVEQVVQVHAHEGELVNEAYGVQEPVVNLEAEALADEEGQTLVNEEHGSQVLAHEGELVNEAQGMKEPTVNVEEEAPADEDGEWTRYLNSDEDGLTVEELLGDGDSEKTLEHVNEAQGVQEPVVNLEEEAPADEEEDQTLVNEELVVNLEEQAPADENGE